MPIDGDNNNSSSTSSNISSSSINDSDSNVLFLEESLRMLLKNSRSIHQSLYHIPIITFSPK
jgi:hypothetical protein